MLRSRRRGECRQVCAELEACRHVADGTFAEFALDDFEAHRFEPALNVEQAVHSAVGLTLDENQLQSTVELVHARHLSEFILPVDTEDELQRGLAGEVGLLQERRQLVAQALVGAQSGCVVFVREDGIHPVRQFPQFIVGEIVVDKHHLA